MESECDLRIDGRGDKKDPGRKRRVTRGKFISIQSETVDLSISWSASVGEHIIPGFVLVEGDYLLTVVIDI